MKIKVGDKVIVIAGKDKGTVGEVLAVLLKAQKVVVEGVNIAKKHEKPSATNEDGGIVNKEMPIHVSNVMLYDPKAKKGSRIAMKVETDSKSKKEVKNRYYKKSGQVVKEAKK